MDPDQSILVITSDKSQLSTAKLRGQFKTKTGLPPSVKDQNSFVISQIHDP